MDKKSKKEAAASVAPIISAVLVAGITAYTSIQLGNLERITKVALIDVEQRKLREQQEARREAFMERHLAKLLSGNDAEQRLGRGLLYVAYPSEAEEIIEQVLPAASKDMQFVLRQISAEAKVVKKETGAWVVIISSDTTEKLAKRWADNARDSNLSPVAIYQRGGFYAVAVGRYPSRTAADQAVISIRPKTRADAYVVALGRWCPAANALHAGDVPLYQCPTP